MRRAVILVLLVWLVVGGLSSWALADRPGWVPDEFQRGGGDELESTARLDPDVLEDDVNCAMTPSYPTLSVESGPGVRSGSGASTVISSTTDQVVWWVYCMFLRW